jgi:hypothetical protein
MVILPTEAVFRYEMMTVSKIQENLALFLTPMFLTQNTQKNLKKSEEKKRFLALAGSGLRQSFECLSETLDLKLQQHYTNNSTIVLARFLQSYTP